MSRPDLAIALRIGTRGSPLALAQANEVRRRLCDAHGMPPDSIAIEVIRTTGDRIQDRPLSEAGGKGLFTKEIEEALLSGAIDLAVHSAKDMPTALPPGLMLAAYLPREDVRDVWISRNAQTMRDLPPGTAVGTASLRRQAFVLRLRPDLQIVSLRGNVETRLRKVAEGTADATLLALAGLKRLGRSDAATSIIPIEDMPPALGQGAIAIEARVADGRVRELLAAIDDASTHVALLAERAFLSALDGSCRTPIAGHAQSVDGRLTFRGLVIRPNGTDMREVMRAGAPADAERLGGEAGEELKARMPPDFFSVP